MVTKKFKKQYKNIKKQAEFKEKEFEKVIELLTNKKVLPIKYKNHILEPKSKRSLGMSYPKWYIT